MKGKVREQVDHWLEYSNLLINGPALEANYDSPTPVFPRAHPHFFFLVMQQSDSICR